MTAAASGSGPMQPSAVPSVLRVGDHRGLTATGAVAVALGAGAIGGVVDVLTGPGLRTVFALCFVLGCAAAAWKVHREDLVATIVIPPLAFGALLLVGAIGSASGAGGSWATQQAMELATALVLKAPVLVAATSAAAVVAAIRVWLLRPSK
jgi:hypothetical protein